ncbi:hypothetical protein [Flammeovirga kamogawensis]|uniref:Uncharacterized protein n=1 Tax=Flammeovirga kamogawensis TaxID=373891 RepID=A0ABX8H0W4_9BACT|nr:hypothetical protein [Flammeovirga kamogawensis]MBB6462271.1 hypothetical protein [Flammeovirga kamogawensis]QWG09333.1 hypothetical protein KM029_22265 [Flammeovirga kamogawensis]TRX64855.1 hypothetical protein EO216_20175 [Flammeovirga kamogawensis]
MKQNIFFEIPSNIMEGLANGTLERLGGVIRDSNNKTVRAWLKEVPLQGEMDSTVMSQLSTLSSSSTAVTNALSIANIGVSVAGFAILSMQLHKINQHINHIAKDIKELKEVTKMSHTIQLYEITSHYQNFSERLRDFSLSTDKEGQQTIIAPAYNDLCRNNNILNSLLHNPENIKSLITIHGIDKVAGLHKLLCLGYQSQIAYNILKDDYPIVKAQLEDFRKKLFSINKNFVAIHSNLGWNDHTLERNEREKFESLLDTSIEIENIFESKIIFLENSSKLEQFNLFENKQLVFELVV